jgi:undecaprenol kinase
MFALELINSALERAIDLVTEEYRVLAKQAKDMAAGAVLIYAMMTVLIGLMIFLPKIFKW